jgi:DNA-binding MarR family transcriptional regulator/predicted GNAT family N-acyltransferase
MEISSPDLFDDLGITFLGSRLKRLADRFQSEAGEVLRSYDMPIQPSQQLVLAALLQHGALSVGEIAQRLRVSQPTVTRGVVALEALGLIAAGRVEDQRQKILSLTDEGHAVMRRAQNEVWPRVARATAALCRDLPGDLLQSLTELEEGLDRSSLNARVEAVRVATAGLRIRDFSDDLADAFYRLNVAWIEEMFAVEQADIDILAHPHAKVIDPGGVILFAETDDLGVVGTCALMPGEDGWWELTKMCVSNAARGRGIGEFLLVQALGRAKIIGIEKLYLLTNTKCEAAVHLYEKHGFRHDADIMRRFGAHYARCTVAMSYGGMRRT